MPPCFRRLPALLPLLLPLVLSCSGSPDGAGRSGHALIHLVDQIDAATYEPLATPAAAATTSAGPRYDFDTGADGWRRQGAVAIDSDAGVLQVRGDLAAGLLVSPPMEMRWSRVREVVLRLRADGDTRVRLFWAESEREFLAFWNRSGAISFDERLHLFRSAEFTVAGGKAFRDYRIAMQKLDPPGRAAGTTEPVLRRLFLQAPGAATAAIDIDAIAVITASQRYAGRDFGRSTERVGDVVREAIFLRGGGRLRLPVAVRPGDRLELMAASDGEAPLRLRIEAPPGRTVIDRVVAAGSGWEPIIWQVDQPADAITIGVESPDRIVLLGHPFLRTAGGAAPHRTILYLVDALGANHLGAYGYDRPTSPVLDRLAGQGALFLDCIAQSTWTRPSTTSVLTGLYPPAHGVVDWSDRLPASVPTLAAAYRAAGYHTAAFITNPHAGISAGLEQGFDVVFETPAVTGSLIPPGGTSGSMLLSSGTSLAINRLLLPWLREHADMPLFVYLHSMDPHFPYHPPPPFQAGIGPPADPADPLAADRRRYDGDVAFNDREIGRLLDLLEILGMAADTTVAITSDHGEEFGEHGGTGHRNHLHGSVTRVPWIVRAPGRVPAGLRLPDRVETIDILPTLLALAGISPPDQVQGRDLTPLLRGESVPERVAWSHLVRRTVAEDRSGLRRSDPIGEIALRDGRWLYLFGDYGEAERWGRLYQLENDPEERHDIAADHPGLVAAFDRRVREWYAAQQAHRAARGEPAAEVRHDEEEERRLRALGYLQ